MPKLNGFDYAGFQKFLSNKCGPQYIKNVYIDIFKPKYKCLHTKSKEICWYKFDEETALWAHAKHEIICDEVFENLDRLLTDTFEGLAEDDPRRKQVGQARIELGKSLADRVTDRIMTSFFDPSFQLKLDTKIEVFNFKNGILDLKTMNFRKRTADDYYTKCLSFDFDLKRKKTLKKQRKMLNNLLLKVCNNNKKDLIYLKQSGAYGLTGRNDLKGMLFMYGPKSNNGKSTFLRMLEGSMPCYCDKINSKTFSSGKEHKFLMDAMSMRIVFMEEVGDESKQDTSLFKEVIDGDKIKLELLYGNGTINFKPKFMLLITCNTIPHFVRNDEGVKNRSNYLKLDNEFIQGVEDCPEKGIYEADTSIKSRLEFDTDIQQAFIYMMLDEIKEFYENGCKLPEMREEQKERSNEFKNIGDYFKEFIEEYFEKTDDENDRISKHELRELYKTYSSTNYGIKFSSDSYIRDNMEKLGFNYKRTYRVNGEKGCYIGVKKNSENIFLEEEDEDTEKEKIVYKNQTIEDILYQDLKELQAMIKSSGFNLDSEKKKKKPSNIKQNDLDFDFDDILDGSEDIKKLL